jgi:KaiC/GvpD/RAD55 family RecA-like ATPase
MLILALVPAALSTVQPNVSGQGIVTVTTQSTTTGLYTYAATTAYQTTVVTSVSTYNSGPLTVPVPDPSLTVDPCGNVSLQFLVVEGEHVSVSLKSQTAFSFLVMSDSVRKNWRWHGNPVLGGSANAVTPCHNVPEGTLIQEERITSYTTSFDFPTSETYWFWFLNGIYTPIVVNFDMVGSPTVFTSTVSSISYITAPTTELLALTTAVSQVGLPFGNLGMLVAGAAVAVVASVLVVARRRKTSHAETRVYDVEETNVSKEQPPPTTHEPRKDTVASQTVTQPKVQLQPIISTGYVDLDKALDGGIPEAFAVVLVSPSYDERDLLLRKVVNSAIISGRLAILVSNDMGRTGDMASRYPKGFYALSPQADKISSHAPNLLKIPSIENLNEASISLSLTIKDVLSRERATRRIMVLDILSDLLLRYKSITTRRWLTDFVGKRKAEGFTIIATLNPLVTTKEETQSIIDFFDGVIEIFEKPLAERTRRFLMIRKMYGQKYSDNEVLMDRDKLF